MVSWPLDLRHPYEHRFTAPQPRGTPGGHRGNWLSFHTCYRHRLGIYRADYNNRDIIGGFGEGAEMKQRINSINTGFASELYVASILFRLGYVVAITMGNTKAIDILVADPKKSSRKISVDVKGLKNTTNWPVKVKRHDKNHFFIFVTYKNRFNDPLFMPETFIVPANRIGHILTKWSGRKDITCVNYADLKHSKYKDAWHLLRR